MPTPHSSDVPALDRSGYCDGTKRIVLVPVLVTVHEPTDTIYKFAPPTEDDVRKAMRRQACERILDEQAVREVTLALVRTEDDLTWISELLRAVRWARRRITAHIQATEIA